MISKILGSLGRKKTSKDPEADEEGAAGPGAWGSEDLRQVAMENYEHGE